MPRYAAETLAEAKVISDYKQARGKIILVRWLYGYRGKTEDPAEVVFNQPIAVRVDRGQPQVDLLCYHDHHIDPVWNVTIVQTTHPELPRYTIRSPWTYGPSYDMHTGEPEDKVVFESFRQKLWRLVTV